MPDRAGRGGSQLVSSLRIALCGCLLTGIMAALLEVVLLAGAPAFAAVDAAFPAIAMLYFVVGVRAWWRRPGSLMGPLVVVGGVAMLVGGLVNTAVPALALVGQLCQTLVLAVTIHLLLAFPTGRLQGWFQHLVVGVAYFVTTLPQAGFVLFDGIVADAAHLVQWVGGVLMMLGTVAALVLALRRATPAQRRTLAPLYAYGIGVVALIPTAPLLFGVLLGIDPFVVSAAQLLALAGLPLVFLLAVIRGAFAATAEVDALATWLGSGPERPPLTASLARALGDPSVTLAYWLPDRGEFVDAEGDVVTVPRPGSRPRDCVPVVVGSEPVGAITFDPTAVTGRAVGEAASVVALAIEGERLTAALRAGETQLMGSRARVVDAADRERARIARDLHDGLQGRLVLLGVDAQRLAKAVGSDADSAALRARATRLRQDIDAAAAEVRRLAHDIMPATLEQRGLALAVEDLTDRMPIPTTLHVRGLVEQLAPEVARTAYFVVAEALANTVKHARASGASVVVARGHDGVDVEVDDDGIGGATLRPGSGLGGLLDRVEALGGRLVVDSPPGGGTRIRGTVPCES